jgi:hypothetical protein
MENAENQSKSRLPVIIQPNAVTSARYDYSQMQKDFMYHFIEKMNSYMTRDKMPNADLFGNFIIELDLNVICKSNNYAPMLAAIRELQKKPISYHFNRDKDIYEVDTTLIASIIYRKGTGKVRIKTTEESLPFLSYIGTGFTSYNKVIALSLQSYYAKRMYELCCRWKDKGFYRTSISEFRKMMSVEDKFESISDMRRFILDKSAEMLTKDADYTFTYALRKENGSKAFNWLEITILATSGEKKDMSAWYIMIYNFLYGVYKDGTAVRVCDFLADQQVLKRASDRIARLKKDIEAGKIKKHGLKQYVNMILENDYQAPEHVTSSKEDKEKKKRKDAAIIKQMEEKVKVKREKEEAEKERPQMELFRDEEMSGEKRGGETKRLGEFFKGVLKKG